MIMPWNMKYTNNIKIQRISPNNLFAPMIFIAPCSLQNLNIISHDLVYWHSGMNSRWCLSDLRLVKESSQLGSVSAVTTDVSPCQVMDSLLVFAPSIYATANWIEGNCSKSDQDLDLVIRSNLKIILLILLVSKFLTAFWHGQLP